MERCKYNGQQVVVGPNGLICVNVTGWRSELISRTNNQNEWQGCLRHSAEIYVERVAELKRAVKRQLREWPICPYTGEAVKLYVQAGAFQMFGRFYCEHCHAKP